MEWHIFSVKFAMQTVATVAEWPPFSFYDISWCIYSTLWSKRIWLLFIFRYENNIYFLRLMITTFFFYFTADNLKIVGL